MKLSCLPVSFFQTIVSGEMPLPEWLAFGREIGLDGTECSLGFVEPIGRYAATDVRRMCDDAALPVSMVTCHPDFTHPDASARAAQVEDMARNLDLCVTLDAPFARVLAGQRHPGVSVDDGVAWAVDGLRQVDRLARERGVRLALENHTKSFFWQHFDFAQAPEVFLRIVDGLGDTSVGVNFDTANPLVAEADPLTLFDRVADRLAIVHVADVARPGEFAFCRIGQGIAPIAEVFRRARARGYDGWVSIEEASRSGPEAFRQAVQFVRTAWQEAV